MHVRRVDPWLRPTTLLMGRRDVCVQLWLLISCTRNIFAVCLSLKCKGAYLTHPFCCKVFARAPCECVYARAGWGCVQQHKCRSFSPRFTLVVHHQGALLVSVRSTSNVWIFVTDSAAALLGILLITRLAAHASLFRRFFRWQVSGTKHKACLWVGGEK